jgi:uncharacterized protein (UPF0248 family)
MGKYDDIINLPHHVSENHPRMSMQARAAQFSPFAALSGHGDAIKETARLTDSQRDLDEGVVADLNRALEEIGEMGHPKVEISYFVPDGKKQGGSYAVANGTVKRIDSAMGMLLLMDGTRIPLEKILNIETC